MNDTETTDEVASLRAELAKAVAGRQLAEAERDRLIDGLVVPWTPKPVASLSRSGVVAVAAGPFFRWSYGQAGDTESDRGDAVAAIRKAAGLSPVAGPPADLDDGETDDDPPRWQDRLIFDFAVSEDSPVVKGTFVTVSRIVSLIVDGATWNDVRNAHPELNDADIRVSLAYELDREYAGPLSG